VGFEAIDVLYEGAERRELDTKVVYRRYASLFFVTGISSTDNELVTLEIIHRYVEVLDRYFGNVCAICYSIDLRLMELPRTGLRA
jgi:hypothetical protein